MKLKLNPLLSILLIIAVSSLLLYFIALHTSERKTTTTQNTFAAAAIKGKLSFKSLRFGVQLIRVDNDSQTFQFKPAISDEGSLFHANTSLGDSILKNKNSLEIVVKGTDTKTAYTAKPVE